MAAGPAASPGTADEIQVAMVASGLCHSDDHIATGDLPVGFYPVCAGHEGAGIVEKVGPNTRGWDVGDHVVFTFFATCGRCRWCATGQQNLRQRCAHTWGFKAAGPHELPPPLGGWYGRRTGGGHQHVRRAHDGSRELGDQGRQRPPAREALSPRLWRRVRWGSAVNSAEVGPSDTVIIMGIGGIGINAVQGAVHTGAAFVIAVDPVAFKREMALKLGATHASQTSRDTE